MRDSLSKWMALLHAGRMMMGYWSHFRYIGAFFYFIISWYLGLVSDGIPNGQAETATHQDDCCN
jgi:hypothetical protein